MSNTNSAFIRLVYLLTLNTNPLLPRDMPQMKKLQIVRTCSSDGEIHFILLDVAADRTSQERKSVDTSEVKEIMKEQAARPLLLLREE